MKKIHKSAHEILKKSDSNHENQYLTYVPTILGELQNNYREYVIPLPTRVKLLEEQIKDILEENKILQKELFELKKEEKIIEIDNSHAEKEILNLYNTTQKPLYYIDIAKTLNLPLKQVVEIVEKLIEDGAIEEVTE